MQQGNTVLRKTVQFFTITIMWSRLRRTFSDRRSDKRSGRPPNTENEPKLIFQNSLRSLKTRSMILSDLDWRSKSVDIIHGMPSGQGTHVLSVQKLTNIGDIEEIVKRQVSTHLPTGVSGSFCDHVRLMIETESPEIAYRLKLEVAKVSNPRFRAH